MTKIEAELVKGTLDLLILRVLQGGTRHGWSISRCIRDASDDAFRIGQGSLYPALRRLEALGWVDAEWGVSELGRRARFYRLTRSGRRRLRAAAQEWRQFADTVGAFMQSPVEDPVHHEPVEEGDRSPAPLVES